MKRKQNKKVYVVLYQSKHSSPTEGIQVWATEDLAYRSISEVIKLDVQEGRYWNDETVERGLLTSIRNKSWKKMMDIHDSYWEHYSQPDIWTILEREIINN